VSPPPPQTKTNLLLMKKISYISDCKKYLAKVYFNTSSIYIYNKGIIIGKMIDSFVLDLTSQQDAIQILQKYNLSDLISDLNLK
jgi:hypothetical protein